jgi:hypothetical protein
MSYNNDNFDNNNNFGGQQGGFGMSLIEEVI